jgi:hypothetical protein
MALLMPTAPIAAGLSRPTMMVSTTDMAIQPSSESTTGTARSNKAASSLRKRVLVDKGVTGAGGNIVLPTLIDPGSESGWTGIPPSTLLGQIQDGSLK